MLRAAAVLPTLLLVAACATVPPPPPEPAVTYEDKLAWILRLEDQRILRDPGVTLPAPVVIAGRPATAAPPPAPDLLRLLRDPEARVRRRAALAIGRVGLREGAAGLVPVLQGDPEPQVREAAAFAMGLVGAADSVGPLLAALEDPSPVVQGRAAQALGLIGPDAGRTAPAIAAMARAHVEGGALDGLAPDDLTHPHAPPTEAVRLAAGALARLKAFEPLASLVLTDRGEPRSHWWPIASALRRVEDPRAEPALRTLLASTGQFTRGFAARGLGAIGAAHAVEPLVQIVRGIERDPFVGVEAIRALAQLKDRRAVPALWDAAALGSLHPQVRAEAVAAIGSTGTAEDADLLLDLIADSVPEVRAAALASLALLDRERFLMALSGLDPDGDWKVRAAVARVLGSLPAPQAAQLLRPLLADTDLRARAAVLRALAAARVPESTPVLFEHLKANDPGVRVAAAQALAELKPAGAGPALRAAYEAARADASYDARAAALSALAELGAEDAVPTLEAALADSAWAVRVRAAELLRRFQPERDTAAEIRPAPTHLDPAVYRAADLVAPEFSPHAYLETDKGTIQIELAVLDAPLTTFNFIQLARKGFFDGLAVHRVVPSFVVQDGDPRGDGHGGPGYAIRDERSERPYLRGTVGMALDWADTGGSQYFITHGPQPHLDARYTVFGQVVSGMEVVDRLAAGDNVRRVRVWDGKSW